MCMIDTFTATKTLINEQITFILFIYLKDCFIYLYFWKNEYFSNYELNWSKVTLKTFYKNSVSKDVSRFSKIWISTTVHYVICSLEITHFYFWCPESLMFKWTMSLIIFIGLIEKANFYWCWCLHWRFTSCSEDQRWRKLLPTQSDHHSVEEAGDYLLPRCCHGQALHNCPCIFHSFQWSLLLLPSFSH